MALVVSIVAMIVWVGVSWGIAINFIENELGATL